MCQQRKDSVYVCELCQNHHKGVGLTSSIENGRISSLPSVETVSLDAKLSCQMPCRQGKVCNLNHFNQPCACVVVYVYMPCAEQFLCHMNQYITLVYRHVWILVLL